jgi:putative transposase
MLFIYTEVLMDKISALFPVRKSLRLQNYDYAQVGGYFVTICSYQRKDIFGFVNSGTMNFNNIGQIVIDTWKQLSHRFPMITLDQFCLLPNHFHGIIFINTSIDPPRKVSLSRIIQCFKSLTTIEIHRSIRTVNYFIWQRGYIDRIIRNDKELNHIREYIVNNPTQWDLGKDNP